MPHALGFDADTAYHTSLSASVRASEAKRLQEKETAEKERRRSLGLPEDEHKSHADKHREKNADPHRQKSVSEKIANLLFNGGRSSKTQMKAEEKVGWGSGAVARERGWTGEGEGKMECDERGSRGGERGGCLGSDLEEGTEAGAEGRGPVVRDEHGGYGVHGEAREVDVGV